MSGWVLSQRQDDAPDGKNYFRSWTAIGPCGTWDVAEAERFESAHAAMQSPAYTFALTFYRPELLEFGLLSTNQEGTE